MYQNKLKLHRNLANIIIQVLKKLFWNPVSSFFSRDNFRKWSAYHAYNSLESWYLQSVWFYIIVRTPTQRVVTLRVYRHEVHTSTSFCKNFSFLTQLFKSEGWFSCQNLRFLAKKCWDTLVKIDRKVRKKISTGKITIRHGFYMKNWV